jgi:DNA repair protein RadA/Sms
MSKNSSLFVCQNCGWSTPRWAGQCSECHQWNTLVEEVGSDSLGQPLVSKSSKKSLKTLSKHKIKDFSITFSQVEALKESKRRFSTTIDEFDRVLGFENLQSFEDNPNEKNIKSIDKKIKILSNEQKISKGMVAGAVMLIGGEPGIGKSTLLTQVVLGMLKESGDGGEDGAEGSNASKSNNDNNNLRNRKIMYVCGEENPQQISLRINRILENQKIKLDKGKLKENLIFVTTTDVDLIIKAIAKTKPVCVVVDSIQTVTTSDLTGSAGSVGQVRECADRLTSIAKVLQVPMFLVGHVTKEGSISGPKVLEHIVDSVLELTGDRTGDLRILRAVKNRFGSIDEVGVFRMGDFGFESVSNPSELFLENSNSLVPGSAVICVMEGTRPIMIEIQALVVYSQLAMPRRVGRGVPLSRIQVLSAVLQKHCNLPLGSNDIFISVAGGFEIKEPGVDLGLAVAIASSLNNKPIKKRVAFIGEVGLLGEIRSVSLIDRRIKEAKRLGFTTVISKKTHKSIKEVLSDLGLFKK